MLCPSCGRENDEHRQDCVHCGAAMVVECPSCERLNLLKQKNCRACGALLGNPTTLVADPVTLVASDALPKKASPSHGTALPPSNGTRLAPGSLIAHRYRVVKFLGEGGSKVVYQAFDEDWEIDVAVAVIKVQGLDAVARTRVKSEVRMMARLGESPHIVTVLNTGDENGQLCIVMQLMAGGSVADLLKKSKGHRLEPKDVIRITDQMCQALEHAHSHGVIHRDLKPANVWLAANGDAKLGDFGLAITRTQTVNKTSSTESGELHLPIAAAGSLYYMSPETFLGHRQDERSDLYSLGAMMYEMVTGQPPFQTDNAVLLAVDAIQVKPKSPSKICSVWPDLESLILKLLEKDPANRPQSAAEVREGLRELGPESGIHKLMRQTGSHLRPTLGIVGSAVVVIVLGVLANYIFATIQKNSARYQVVNATPISASSAAPGIETMVVADAESSPAIQLPAAALPVGSSPAPSPAAAIAVVPSPAPSPAITGAQSALCDARAPTLAGVKGKWPPVPMNPCGSDVSFCAGNIDSCVAKARTIDADSAAELAYVYLNGLGVPTNNTLAANWSKIAAAKGNPLGEDTLGHLYAAGLDGAAPDYDNARDLYQKAAAQDCALAQTDLGDLYINGNGVRRDDAAAVDWYRKAALQNDPMGQNNLGYLYLHGLGVQKDYKQALDWLLKSSAQGNGFAQDSIGYIYQAGLGVNPDPKLAFQCYKAAAEQGFAESQMHLAELYKNGTGVDQNVAEAVRWYCTAAAAGKLAAQAQVQKLKADCAASVPASNLTSDLAAHPGD